MGLQRSQNGFRALWLFYFVVCAAGWCSIAGVGLLLSFAFLADSSPRLGEYLSGLAQVVLVLFVYPLIVFVFLSGTIAGLHVGLRGLFASWRQGTSTTVLNSSHLSDQDSEQRASYSAAFPLTQLIVSLFLIACGATIIIGNVPRSLGESGLVPTVFTALVFFVPLVLAPTIWMVFLLKRYYRNKTP